MGLIKRHSHGPRGPSVHLDKKVRDIMMDRRRSETDWREQSVFLTILTEQLEIRKREHGYAYVTPSEEAWLRAHGMELTDRHAIVGRGGKKPAPRQTSSTRTGA